MKITQESLSTPTASTAETPLGKDPPDPLLPYHKGEVKLNNSDPAYLHSQRAKPYAERHGFRLVNNLQEALQKRMQGQKVLTMREADIAARSNLDLNDLKLGAAIHSEDAFSIVEDVAGYADSVFELRSFYNRGIQYFKTKAQTATEESNQKAKKAMQDTLNKLRDLGVPAWPEETNHGFPLEFCKPEFMTFQQYQDRMKKPVQREFGNGDRTLLEENSRDSQDPESAEPGTQSG